MPTIFRRLSRSGAALAALAVAAPAAAVAMSAAAPSGAAAALPPAPVFSHMVVVDQQRPGFEPDVKVGPNGDIFSSVPFGFSTTQSFVWSSRDGGSTYQLTPGNVGPGKPTTCVGGGDTDLYLDPAGNLYFSDLQGLTNISQSVSGDGGATWSTNCAGVPNTPDDRMWFTGTGTLGQNNLNLYEDFDSSFTAVTPSNLAGNQLAETVSHDGIHFQPVVNTAPTGDCTGVEPYDCVSSNEGISGPQVVDPVNGNLYIAHNDVSQSEALVAEGAVTPGAVTTATWTESPILNAPLCADKTCKDASGNAEAQVGENFVAMARDGAGYLYVVFTSAPLDHASSNDPNFGATTAPSHIYVVHSLTPAGKVPSALAWSQPTRVDGAGGTSTFPWIVAGSDGRVDVAWYHSDETSEQGTCASGSGTCTLYGAANLAHAEWGVQLGQSLNAHTGAPTYRVADVSEHPIKFGQICTNGLGCATGGDRSLGDFLQVGIDGQGAALVSYVDDTSQDVAGGEDAGPEVISHQIGGASLYSDVGTVQGEGPSAKDSVTQSGADANYSANGTRTPVTPNLALTGASLTGGTNGAPLVAKIDVQSLDSLAVTPNEGGADAAWILRWTQVTPGQPGNGHIWYAGMESDAGGTPRFFDGDAKCVTPSNPEEHCKYFEYPGDNTLTTGASYDPVTGIITITIPAKDVGLTGTATPLYSATAFTATSAVPFSTGEMVFNEIDATPPFDHNAG